MLQFGPFRLDTANECLWRGGEQIALTPRPFAVLRYLVEHPGRLITHNELLDALWPDTFVQPQVLRTYMLELRRTLGDSTDEPVYIRTHAKRGYVFVAQVKECSDAVAAESPSPTPAAPIVGREKELRRLHALAQSAENGERQIAFVAGEPGIGKTALLDAWRRGLEDPWISGQGQCVEGLREREDFYPVMEALGQLSASARSEEVCRMIGKIAPSWVGALGQAQAAGAIPPQARAVAELCAALEELAKKAPVMLVLEDLHAADDSTLHLLSALARRRTPAKLMVLATYRPPEKGNHATLRALKQDLQLHRLATEILLGPLTRSAVNELIARELGQEELPAGLVGFLHQRSQGNPLFALAVLEHLIAERHLLSQQCDGATVWELRTPPGEIETSIPAGLAQTIEIEIERLTREEQTILEAASLTGISFPVWSVAAALEKETGETEEACQVLARRLYFVEHAGTDELPDGTHSEFYVFAHDLYREVLYRRQPRTRRAERHARIARRLSELFAGREERVAREIAMHYEAAGDHARAQAARQLLPDYTQRSSGEASPARTRPAAAGVSSQPPSKL